MMMSTSSANVSAPGQYLHTVDDMLSEPSSDFDDDSEDYSESDSDYDSDYDETETNLHVAAAPARVVTEIPRTPAQPQQQAKAKPAPVSSGWTTAKVERPSATVNSTFKVPVAAKKPGAGIFLSSVMRQFLTRNHSDSDLAALSGRNETIARMIQRSDSTDKLPSHNNDQSRMIFVHQDKTKTTTVPTDNEPLQKPKDLLQELLGANGCTNTEPRSYKSLSDYFMHVTPHMIAAYDMTLMTAVRTNDLETIEKLYKAGKTLQCCNKFHESILHAAARRGSTEVMNFLLNTANLNLKVVCDSGRTPLHDACWTGEPNFDVIRMILEQCPEFLIISDNRNFTPLDYIPKEAWKQWCAFMKEHPALITPQL